MSDDPRTASYLTQLPDVDPVETGEWVEALDGVIDRLGPARAQLLLARLHQRAVDQGVPVPPGTSTPYVNTIPTPAEPDFPGDEGLERRIRALIRWNAAVMVVRANRAADGIGGHLSTFASSAALVDVGMHWFFRGKADGNPGDHVYLQGHASPGIYARAFLEGRLDEGHLDRFRRELGGGGLPSYPHPHLMPDFWEYPTVSMGLGPINSIYQARFLRYLANRGIDDTSESRVWCFVGDGETDEPETLGSISLAAREGLDNLTWVVNCNLQRLDGPVRGNAKIIQELESIFTGAGWNVIKVVWGSAWDPLLAADTDGLLLERMNTTPDGDFQRYAVADGAHIRNHFFGTDPRLRALVDHLDDDDLRNLPRGGHDYRKLYAAYHAAVNTTGRPTVILAKTVKGWTLGPEVESRNVTHQIKKMTGDQLVTLARRLHLDDDLDLDAIANGEVPYLRPPDDSPEVTYLQARRQALGGPLPSRPAALRTPLPPPDPKAFAEFAAGSGDSPVTTTAVATRLLRNLMRDPDMGSRMVPIVPDEARTFGMDALFREFRIYAHAGQRYEPVDHGLLLSYVEDAKGQILEEGITEAGSLASWTAAGTAHATRGVPMVPLFIFYSMFGFQRVGDLIWAAADAGAKGFLVGATAGRTTLAGEGLQHNDGHSHLLASVVPTCRAWDPSFAYEVAAIVDAGLRSMYVDDNNEFHYLTVYNEPWPMPAQPEGVDATDIIGGLYRFATVAPPTPDGTPDGNPDGNDHDLRAAVVFAGSAHGAARTAADLLAARHGVTVDLFSAPGLKQVRAQAMATERWNRLHPDLPPDPTVVASCLAGHGPVVVVTDQMAAVGDQISRWVPAGRPFVSLGTDGFGRSDDRGPLRRFFEVDADHVVVAVLGALADMGTIDAAIAAGAIADAGIDPDSLPPWVQ